MRRHALFPPNNFSPTECCFSFAEYARPCVCCILSPCPPWHGDKGGRTMLQGRNVVWHRRGREKRTGQTGFWDKSPALATPPTVQLLNVPVVYTYCIGGRGPFSATVEEEGKAGGGNKGVRPSIPPPRPTLDTQQQLGPKKPSVVAVR